MRGQGQQLEIQQVSTPTNSTSVVNAPGTYTLTVTNPVNACTSTAVLQ
jgi:hypothetical protein